MREMAESQLKQACRLTGAAWAALVGPAGGEQRVLASHGLTSSAANRLSTYLSTEAGATWFHGLARKRGGKTSGASNDTKLGELSLRGFGLGDEHAILVGARKLTSSGCDTWSLVAELVALKLTAPAEPAVATLPPESAYDSSQALENFLRTFIGNGHDRGGWLAIRRGDRLVVAATQKAGARGAGIALESPSVDRIRRSRSMLIVRRDDPAWESLPPGVPGNASFWAGLPLVVKDRFIGAVAVWGRKALSEKQLRELSVLARRYSPQVDVVVSLGEVTRQLHRLATLNEFALAISSAEELPQIAQRVLAHLGAIFPKHTVSLYVPAADTTQIREFRSGKDGFTEHLDYRRGHPMAENLVQSLPKSGAPSEEALAETTGGSVTLPLRYRQATVGLLTLRGDDALELSRYDRSMLAVVASYLAGVVEHVRLRAEAEDRARSLEQTVEQLREAELTASNRLAAQQAAESQLVQAAKLVAVGEMAAGVAHELNNPLTTVSGFAELILDETPVDAPYRPDLEMVLHEAHRARSVVRRLLDFARQGDHARVRADLNEIIQDVLALMTHLLHTSGVQLEVNLTEGLPWIVLDGNQMKQVFLNLFHNALHAMPGGGRLRVSTELAHRTGREWIVARVVDDGIGMDAGELDRIFEPFYTTRSESGGTGLGLSVTYGIVIDHGGTIEVQSQRGSGTTFAVWLPV